MFFKLFEETLSLKYDQFILVKDYMKIIEKSDIYEKIEELGFTIIEYKDVEEFRFVFENNIKNNPSKKVFVIVKKIIYIPYDIYNFFKFYDLNYCILFPRLNSYGLENRRYLEFDLVAIAYSGLYDVLSTEAETEEFLDSYIYKPEYVKSYIRHLDNEMEGLLGRCNLYNNWIKIAKFKSKRNLMSLYINGENNPLDEKISAAFHEYMSSQYGKLSGRSYFNGPLIVSKVMDYLLMENEKTAIIIMDGMSISDWLILQKYIDNDFDMQYTFALAPTITAISRQSLLSGLLPIEHKKPFSLVNEKKQFVNKANEVLNDIESINYYRGFDFVPSYKDRFICTIINDIDDLVHSQLHGLNGHYESIQRLAKSGKLNDLIDRLLKQGFQVYITSDHGNKESVGVGRPTGMGVEVETKSQRMIILKNYASINSIKENYKLKEYIGHYLPKDYSYLVCEDESALGKKGETIMSHGGISIEEVIVPFIKIKGDTKINE